ncbi:MAG: hypothetical protein DDT42_01669 [candidate division WS2 bacterium]|uniref:Uncharacterized protein n=1 Tax=Psychracetigena formicireducens TaxID=2986056 RepID=A0A9E2BIV7_PSYF1|nr:hypothetical protein [Candidatus Psychracetigena formicireducens]
MKFSVKVNLPPSLNVWANQHWATRSREKNQFCNDVYGLLCEELECPLPQFEKLKVRYLIRSKRRMDEVNRIIINKLIGDSLVRAQIIPDDTPDHFEDEFPKWEFYDGRPEVIVTFESREVKRKMNIKRKEVKKNDLEKC